MRFLAGKRLVWTEYLRVFCDNGHPLFRILPRFRRMNYYEHWQIYGFAMYLWGREINFSFGRDVNGLYRDLR